MLFIIMLPLLKLCHAEQGKLFASITNDDFGVNYPLNTISFCLLNLNNCLNFKLIVKTTLAKVPAVIQLSSPYETLQT